MWMMINLWNYLLSVLTGHFSEDIDVIVKFVRNVGYDLRAFFPSYWVINTLKFFSGLINIRIVHWCLMLEFILGEYSISSSINQRIETIHSTVLERRYHFQESRLVGWFREFLIHYKVLLTKWKTMRTTLTVNLGRNVERCVLLI